MTHRAGATLHSVDVVGDVDGARVVRTAISVAALPVSGSATQTLTPQGEATEVHVHCVVQADTRSWASRRSQGVVADKPDAAR
ncbi:hypothetical protein ACT4S2_02705 [Kocuria turfanensis]|uniref:hypothetical protein n=1 Tax=Kocuria turfanensis TaxID=388357 RepID=UPI004035D19E